MSVPSGWPAVGHLTGWPFVLSGLDWDDGVLDSHQRAHWLTADDEWRYSPSDDAMAAALPSRLGLGTARELQRPYVGGSSGTATHQVALLHPGYVKTEMTGNTGHVTPEEAAAMLLDRVDDLDMEHTGVFWHANGEELPW